MHNSVLHNYELVEAAQARWKEQIFRAIDLKNGYQDRKKLFENDIRLRWMPPLTTFGATYDPRIPNANVLSKSRRLIERCNPEPLRVNCSCICVAPLATLYALTDKYGLTTEVISQDTSGRQQILRANLDDSSDFIIAASAPFFFNASQLGLRYRALFPIYQALAQVLTRTRGSLGRHGRIFLYPDSSAEEFLLSLKCGAGTWSPRIGANQKLLFGPADHVWSDRFKRAEVTRVETVEELATCARHLEAGDFVILWEPLTSALKFDNLDLCQVGNPFYYYVSLMAHEGWLTGALGDLRTEFETLFISEWTNCYHFPSWALECLEIGPKGLPFFAEAIGTAFRGSDGTLANYASSTGTRASTSTRPEEVSPMNRMERRGKSWRVCFMGDESDVPTGEAMAWLTILLQHENEELTVDRMRELKQEPIQVNAPHAYLAVTLGEDHDDGLEQGRETTARQQAAEFRADSSYRSHRQRIDLNLKRAIRIITKYFPAAGLYIAQHYKKPKPGYGRRSIRYLYHGRQWDIRILH